MGNLDALAFGGKQHGVITHHVPGTDGFETDFLAGALAGEAFAAVHCTLFQVAPQGVSDNFAHTQGGAGGGVFFVAVVGLDDFHVVVVAQGRRGGAQEVEDDVNANAHVGREHHRGDSAARASCSFSASV